MESRGAAPERGANQEAGAGMEGLATAAAARGPDEEAAAGARRRGARRMQGMGSGARVKDLGAGAGRVCLWVLGRVEFVGGMKQRRERGGRRAEEHDEEDRASLLFL